jgi:hypothetical protein
MEPTLGDFGLQKVKKSLTVVTLRIMETVMEVGSSRVERCLIVGEPPQIVGATCRSVEEMKCCLCSMRLERIRWQWFRTALGAGEPSTVDLTDDRIECDSVGHAVEAVRFSVIDPESVRN